MSPASPRKKSARGGGVEATPQPEPMPPAAEAAPAPVSTAALDRPRSRGLALGDLAAPHAPPPTRAGTLRPGGMPRSIRQRDANRQTSNWNWSKVRLAPTMTREEAHFWLFAIAEVMRRDLQPGFFVQELGPRGSLRRAITLQEAAKFTRDATAANPSRPPVRLSVPPRDLITLVAGAPKT